MFRKSRPSIRPYEPKDNGYLWSAYKVGSFDLPADLTQEQFLVAIARKFGSFPLVWVIEDDTKAFRAGRGQIGLVCMKTDGWAYEPHVHFFKWADKRNKLRAAVAFFHMMRNTKAVGACVVRTIKKDFAYMKHMEKYGLLYVRGKIPNGSPLGHIWVFSIDGKRAE